MGDVDIALRHLATRFGSELARTWVVGSRLETRWLDTQLTTLDRRIDKALEVRVDGRSELLHLEFEWAWRPDLPYRIYEYQAMLSMALRAERGNVPPIRSVVVLLTRASSRRSRRGKYKTSAKGELFSGARFEIDRVYAVRLEDLMTREAPFWLALSPLTRDFGEPTLAMVVDALTKRVQDPQLLADVAVTMSVLASHEPKQRGMAETILAAFPQELIMQSEVYQWGLEKGLEKGLGPLRHLYERRLSRSLTEAEHIALRERLTTLGPDRIGDVLFEIEGGEELEAWLADPEAS